MDQHLHNAHQQITFADLIRISTLADQRQFDEILHLILRKAGAGTRLADGESGFFPGTGSDAQLAVAVGSGGDRATGFGMKIQVGLGFRRDNAAAADRPKFIPLFGAAEKTFTTANSDPTDPRMDHVYMKPKDTDGNSQTVNIIDPNPPNNITAESRDTNRSYDYDFAYVAGTPDPGAAGGTGAPSPPVGYSANDLIATILVLAGSGAIDPAEITSTRTLFEVDSNLISGVTSLAASAITVSPAVEGETDAQSALEALEAAINNAAAVGVNIGRLEYVNTQSVQIAPGLRGEVRIDVDGTILTSATPIVFDLTTDLESPQTESSDTPYYCYVFDVASVITPKISKTAPDDIGGTKPGYHPTQTTWRCVGSFINDGSNIEEFLCTGNVHRFLGRGISYSLTEADTPTAWANLSINIPETMPYCFGIHAWKGSQAWGLLGAADASPNPGGVDSEYGSTPSGAISALGEIDEAGNTYLRNTAHVEIDIVDRSNPQVAHAVGSTGLGTTDDHKFYLRGWYDPWAPRGGY